MKDLIYFLLLSTFLLSGCSKQEESIPANFDVKPDFFAQKWKLIETTGAGLITETYEMIKDESGLAEGDQGMQAWPDQTMMIWNFNVPSKLPTSQGTWKLSKDENNQYSLDLELFTWPDIHYTIQELNKTRMVLERAE